MRKPGAFARYRFREQLFPTMRFRLAYDALREWRGERADVEYVRILHLAATTMEANVDSALSLLLETGKPFDYAAVRDLAEPRPPEAPVLIPVREAGPEDLRPPPHGQLGRSGGVRMMDTDTSVIQERIGQLRHQFKLPTMGAQSVARFTAAGHGEALPTFLEVLEQEAEDRRHRRIDRLRQASRLPSGKTWETFEHHRMPLALRQQLDHLAQGAEESEVLFTLIAERYERRSLGITSNLVFSEWERIFANPMATAAAIDRVVHHSVILEFAVPSYRTDAAQQRGQVEEVNRQN